jgi:hypothetical protein
MVLRVEVHVNRRMIHSQDKNIHAKAGGIAAGCKFIVQNYLA